MSQTPRHINTSRSLNRPDPAAAAPRHAASSTDAKQSAGGAHNEPPRRRLGRAQRFQHIAGSAEVMQQTGNGIGAKGKVCRPKAAND